MINGKTQLFGFIAHPAHHSRSPRMHNLSFQHWGINARYLAFDVAPGNLPAAIAGIRSMGIAGVNLSMPFKQTVVPLLDDLTPRAQRINAVNTIKNDHGRLIGDSTDGAGLFQNLQSRGLNLRGKRVVILGAGGAGKAIIAASLDYRLAQVDVFKRQTTSYPAVATWVTGLAQNTTTPLRLHPYEAVQTMQDLVAQADLIINATSVGMTTAGVPVPTSVLEQLHPGQVVYDVIYQPLETEFLALARQRGCETHNGLGMLIWQGALAFQFWTGKPMPVPAVEADLLASLTNETPATNQRHAM
ncbi:shikimate dehydrogenase [Levilactobacillus acidifarinae]|uniref:Shikimate dehydrogenase (NADP(+)) n=1 Tax=Levilactobacillus acidifarinae DSM 19394 = JCM 15949 TaxID=1423715 RepID=A0A0R1LLP1_9LACO|nr:shikimate dehydrogenase [Levilactobacillus acidifarinae]KRK96781.1 shikimate dehydrogenase 1 [Levilactobacillus acidifarinae DSM 19394]GEO69852.1 shikimate dehydrogenase (NADP(+)) [Levilactobacillus acidifarinae]